MTAITLPAAPVDLRELRHAKGISQERVAQLAGCSTSMVRQLERGYLPNGSAVFPRVLAVLNDRSPAGEPGSGETITGEGFAGHVRSG